MNPNLRVPEALRSSLLRGETWHLAWEAVRADAVRTILTMLGVTIGSTCIVLVVSIALAGKDYVVAQIEGVGTNIVYAGLQHGGSIESPANEISPADLESIRADAADVVRAAGTHDIKMTIAADGQDVPVNVVGVTEEFQAIRNLDLLKGRYFDDDEMERRSKVCLITKHLAAITYPPGEAIDQQIRVGELSFTVIGVFQERVATFGESEIANDSLLVPFSLIKYYTGEEYFMTLYVQADRPEDVSLVTKEVGDLLRQRHRNGAKYTVENLTALLEATRRISLALTLVLLFVALVVLGVSGIGIMNIMLVTVTERTHEIGIRRAVGARRADIRCQFLVEAVLISGAGSVIGVLIGISLPFVADVALGFFPELANLSLPLSWMSVLVALLVSCFTGLIFGYLPASRAANLHPSESLRYE
jgi:putative ABC transport system permease protein